MVGPRCRPQDMCVVCDGSSPFVSVGMIKPQYECK